MISQIWAVDTIRRYRPMQIYGKAPFLECSSREDKRFSAFYAKVNGSSIEEPVLGCIGEMRKDVGR